MKKLSKSKSVLGSITTSSLEYEPKTDQKSEVGESVSVGPVSGSAGIKEENDKEIQSSIPELEENVIDEKVEKKIKRRKRWIGICTGATRYESVRRAAKVMGFKDVDDTDDWTLFWTDCSVSLERCMAMKKYQRINHFPGMAEICRKDLLSRNLTRLHKLFPKDYNIFPRTWVLPTDQGDMLSHMRGRKRTVYIAKPERGSQGRGIFLTRHPNKDIKNSERYIIQHYISRPLIIDNYKFDLRIYALITSCDPLRIYVFNEGLARFATMTYSEPVESNLDECCMHLTNYSINKHSGGFIRDDDESGSKRRFSSIKRWLLEHDYDAIQLFSDIDDLIIKTLISAHPILRHNYRTCFPSHTHYSACFEILGFDVLIDRKLKPWLLEVNHSPSFHTDSKLDRQIKGQLLQDTLRMLHCRASDKYNAVVEDRRQTQLRLAQTSKDKGKDHKTSTVELKDQIKKANHDNLIWESKHLGGFRRVYPTVDASSGNNSSEGGPEQTNDKYAKFFEKTGSLFQTTASTKAREEAARLQRLEIEAKAARERERLNPSDPGESGTKNNSRSKYRKSRYPQQRAFMQRTSHAKIGELDDMKAQDIREEDEVERRSALSHRESLLRGLGVVEQIYRTLHCTSGTSGEPRACQNSLYAINRNASNTNIRRFTHQMRRGCVDLRCPARRQHSLSLSVGGGEVCGRAYRNSNCSFILSQRNFGFASDFGLGHSHFNTNLTNLDNITTFGNAANTWYTNGALNNGMGIGLVGGIGANGNGGTIGQIGPIAAATQIGGLGTLNGPCSTINMNHGIVTGQIGGIGTLATDQTGVAGIGLTNSKFGKHQTTVMRGPIGGALHKHHPPGHQAGHPKNLQSQNHQNQNGSIHRIAAFGGQNNIRVFSRPASNSNVKRGSNSSVIQLTLNNGI